MGDIIDALVSCGLPPSGASRAEKAVQKAATAAATRFFSRPYTGKPDSARGDFALTASAPGTSLVKGSASRGGALNVDGLAVFDGDITVSKDIAADGKAAFGSVNVRTVLAAQKAHVDRIEIPGCAILTGTSATFHKKIEAFGPIVSNGENKFSGPNTFNGQLKISGKVDWNGPRNPVNVGLISFLRAPNDTSESLPGGIVASNLEVGVLNSKAEPSRLGLIAEMTGGIAPLPTLVSITPSASGVSFPLNISVNAQFNATTEVITFLTGASFDPETCSIAYTTGTASVVTGGLVSLSAGSGAGFSAGTIAFTASLQSGPVQSFCFLASTDGPEEFRSRVQLSITTVGDTSQ